MKITEAQFRIRKGNEVHVQFRVDGEHRYYTCSLPLTMQEVVAASKVPADRKSFYNQHADYTAMTDMGNGVQAIVAGELTIQIPEEFLLLLAVPTPSVGASEGEEEES